MILKLTVTVKTVLVSLAALVMTVVCGALLVAYSGIYNVAASAGHPLWLDWFLALGMRRSVQVNSNSVVQPELATESVHLPLGAAHFHTGCAVCHGYPGTKINPVFDHMLPTPPSLQEKAKRWQSEELFWIVKHGLQYAGMPSWSGTGREDEVWSVAMFLKHLPDMDEQQYEQLAKGNSSYAGLTVSQSAINRIDNNPALLAQVIARQQCDACHDNAQSAPTSPLIPRLAGQRKGYLSRSLQEYKHNTRQSGFMEAAVTQIDDKVLGELAKAYAQMTSPPWQTPSPKLNWEEGRTLAEVGYPEKDIPACLSCHGDPGRMDYPKLDGQSALYLSHQLKGFRKGTRNQTAYGKLMTQVAKSLTDTQINAVAHFFAHRQTERASDE